MSKLLFMQLFCLPLQSTDFTIISCNLRNFTTILPSNAGEMLVPVPPEEEPAEHPLGFVWFYLALLDFLAASE